MHRRGPFAQAVVAVEMHFVIAHVNCGVLGACGSPMLRVASDQRRDLSETILRMWMLSVY